MNYKHILLAFAMACFTATSAEAQNKSNPARKAKATATNADSLQVRKLIDAAKQGDSEAQNTLGTYYYAGKKVKRNYEVALKWFSMAAQQKHVKAIANMGLCYQLGKGIERDSMMAVKLYKESIKAGNIELVKQREELVEKSHTPFNINLLADIYYNGCGKTVEKNHELALKYYIMADANDLPEAAFIVANLYDQDMKYAEALPFYQKAAARGNAMAEYKCGDYLCNGKGTAVDKAKAVKHLEKAVGQNIPNAMMLLGNLLYKGDDVQQDYSKAMNLYKRAAVNGNPAAAWNVGIMYKNGQGAKENYLIALQWFANAATKGMDMNFQKQLNEANVEIKNGWKNTDFYTFVHALWLLEGPTPNLAEAVKLLTALEKKNLPVATTILGMCYADKQWKKANEKKMLECYEKAAKEGDPHANYLLAKLHLDDTKVIKANKSKVVECYEKAAEAGYAPAQCELGNLYYTGKIVSKNITKAIVYYNDALLNGYLSEDAAQNLATCFQQGLGGVEQNADLARSIEGCGQPANAWTALLQSVSFE